MHGGVVGRGRGKVEELYASPWRPGGVPQGFLPLPSKSAIELMGSGRWCSGRIDDSPLQVTVCPVDIQN